MPILRLGCNLPPQTKQPLPEEVFLFPPDCGLSGSGQQRGSQLGQYYHSFVARTPLIGHENVTRTCGGTQGGSCVIREAGHSSHLMNYNPVCMKHKHTPRESEGKMGHGMKGHTPSAKRNTGGSSPSCHKCAKGHLPDCPPGFCWPHRKSGFRECCC